jgi:hypothetical protein
VFLPDLRRRRLGPVDLADEQPTSGHDPLSHQREGAGKPTTDPRSPDATHDVEVCTELRWVTCVTLDESDSTLDSEFGSSCPSVRKKRRVNVDADAGPDFGATFASSQVDGSAARKCFHYA